MDLAELHISLIFNSELAVQCNMEYFQRLYSTKIIKIFRKIPLVFRLHSLKYDFRRDKYICIHPSRIYRVKIQVLISILVAICTNGLYRICNIQNGALEKSFCSLFLIAFSFLFVSFVPLLLHPDMFASLLNGVRTFRKEECIGR